MPDFPEKLVTMVLVLPDFELSKKGLKKEEDSLIS